jgi:hypothetical protein
LANTISLNEPLVDTLIGTWTGMELWHGSVQAGPFTLLSAIPYVLHQTVYTYVDSAGVSTDWYQVRRYAPGPTYGPFSAAWPVTAPASARRSLLALRRLVAQALHSLTVVTTTAPGNAAGTSIIGTRLANAITANRYKHAWVMPVTGTQATVMRRVRSEDALNLTTGELMVAPAFPGQVASGVDVELHRLLPPDDDDGWTGLRSLINQALGECWVTQRLPMTGVNGQASYSLAAYEEWLDPDAVLEVRRAALDGTLNSFAAGQFVAVGDVDALSVQIAPTLPTGNAATVEVFRPTDTWIRVGGVWGPSTVGLVNDSDECLLTPDLVVAVTLANAYESLATGPEGARYDALATKARTAANVAKLMQLSHKQRQLGSELTTGYGWHGDGKEWPLGMGWSTW